MVVLTKEKKRKVIKLAQDLVDELEISGKRYDHIYELNNVLENYTGQFVQGLVTTVSLLIEAFPKIECEEVRMKTERFSNRLELFIREI